MASGEVQPFTAQQPIEGELNVLTMSKEQIVNLISATHLHDEENFDADSLLAVVQKIHEHAYVKMGRYHVFQSDEEDMENLEKKMSIASFFALLGGLFQFSLESLLFAFGFIKKSFIQKEDVEKPKEKGHENLEENVSRLRDSFNPQLLCILDQLSSEIACKAPSVEVIMSILNKLSNYSWNAKLLLILAAYALNYEDFLDIPNNVPATLKHQKFQEMFGFNSAFCDSLDTIEYFLKVKKVTKDEPALLSNVAAGDFLEGVYWIIVTCTTHMCCLSSNEDKTQDISLLNHKTWSIFDDLHGRIRKIEEMFARKKLKELFDRDAMQPLIDGSTNEQVSIDVLKEKNLLLFISGLNIHRNDKSDLMSIYDRENKKGDQYKIVWIPIVEQWTNNLRRKFEMLQSKIKMPWYIVQYFSTVARIKSMEDPWYDNGPIILLMNPQGDVENDALYLFHQLGMSDFPYTLPIHTSLPYSACWRTPGPYEIEEYTFLCGGKDKRWIEQFSQKVNVVAEDQLIQEVNIIIELSCVGKDRKQLDFEEEIKELLRSFKNERRWAVFMTNFSEVISKDGTTILKVLEKFEEWKVNVRERGFQICFKEYHDRLLPTHGSQP